MSREKLMFTLDNDGSPEIDVFLGANGKRIPLEIQHETAGDAVIECRVVRGGQVHLDLHVTKEAFKRLS